MGNSQSIVTAYNQRDFNTVAQLLPLADPNMYIDGVPLSNISILMYRDNYITFHELCTMFDRCSSQNLIQPLIAATFTDQYDVVEFWIARLTCGLRANKTPSITIMNLHISVSTNTKRLLVLTEHLKDHTLYKSFYELSLLNFCTVLTQ